jgi:lipopolysaccharide export system protein LptA
MKALAILLLACASLSAAETNLFPQRPGLTIDADFAEFRLKSGVFFYSNNVTVTDPPARPGGPPTVLQCRELTATRDATGKFDSIVALHGVQIDQGSDRARGNRAVYYRSNEWMVLTGPFDASDTNHLRPYLVRDQSTISGDEIIYERSTGNIRFSRPSTKISTNMTSGTNRSGSPKTQFPFPTK